MLQRFLILFLSVCIQMTTGAELQIGPYLQDVQPTRITIIWETDAPVKGTVRFGIDSTQLNLTQAEQSAATLHQITLDNLTPAQAYYYQCVWPGVKTTKGRFHTAPGKNSAPVRIAAVGDSRSNPKMWHKIAEFMRANSPDIVLNTGDLVSSGTRAELWDPQLFKPAEQLMREVPFYPVSGNHEKEADLYYKYFGVNPDKKPWWSFDYGCVHLIGLNSNIAGDPASEQYRFLEADLKANRDKKWIVIQFHHPLFHCHPTRQVYPIRYFWQPLFEKYGVDLVLSGHDHYYHRTFPIGRMAERQHGVVHITTAGGGAPLYPTIETPYTAFARSIHHYLLLDATEKEMQIRMFTHENKCVDAIVITRDQEIAPPNLVEYGMFELEHDLNEKLGYISPTQSKDGLVTFDTSITIKTNFYLPVTGYYAWEAPEAWQVETKNFPLKILPGEVIEITLKASVPRTKMLPTPTLKLHLAADNSGRNTTKKRPYQHYLGFRNQDIELSLEKGAYGAASAATLENPESAFNFIRYYPNSDYVNHVLKQIGGLVFHKKDPKFLTCLDEILKTNPTDLNKFRYFPFYFLFDDFSKWDAWLAAINRLPAAQKSSTASFIYALSRLENLNSHFVKNWKIIGPFEYKDNQGLAAIYPPEQEIDFSKTYPGKAGRQIGWKDVRIKRKSINFVKKFNESGKNLVGYAFTKVVAKRAGKILLLLGSNDGPAVWVNGQEVHRNYCGRGAAPCQDIINVPVQQGGNDILIKVDQWGGDWELMLQISDREHILVEN